MPVALINGKILYFAHIPKCGGSSVEAYLARKGDVGLLGRVQRTGWARCNPQHIHRVVADGILPEAWHENGFIVFRDPVNRMKSEFRMKARPLRWTVNPVNLLMKLRRMVTGAPLYELRFRGIPFHVDFDLFVRAALFVARRSPYLADNHFRPQSEFWREGYAPFFLEDGLRNVFDWIDQTTGTDPIEDEFHQKKGAPAETSCSPATERRIRDYYSADYALFERLRDNGA